MHLFVCCLLCLGLTVEGTLPGAPTLRYPPHIWIQCENRAGRPRGWLKGERGSVCWGILLANIKGQGAIAAATAGVEGWIGGVVGSQKSTLSIVLCC